ncbi:hypothetical protein IAU60_004731 [Kwoniella sp. DSM 27419]
MSKGSNKQQDQSLIIGTQAGGAEATPAQLKDIRAHALADVRRRAESTGGSGKLRGKVGVITGVGPETGIGTAAAKQFAREGAAHIYLVDYDDRAVPSLVKMLNTTYPKTKVTFVKADAASHQAISSLVSRALKEEGRLDFFFANAGISQVRPKLPAGTGSGGDQEAVQRAIDDLRRLGRPVAQVDEDEFNEVMRINALSVFVAIKYASEAMKQTCPEKGKMVSGGSLILTASIAGLKSNAGPIPYSASKAAVVSMAQTSAYDLAGYNIRVNAVCPGLIETDMTKAMFDLARVAGKQDKMGVLNPAQRQGIGAEVAQVALFLASDDSSYVNGQAIAIDGGMTAGVPYAKMKL